MCCSFQRTTAAVVCACWPFFIPETAIYCFLEFKIVIYQYEKDANMTYDAFIAMGHDYDSINRIKQKLIVNYSNHIQINM